MEKDKIQEAYKKIFESSVEVRATLESVEDLLSDFEVSFKKGTLKGDIGLAEMKLDQISKVVSKLQKEIRKKL
jgi:hypothetical protein